MVLLQPHIKPAMSLTSSLDGHHQKPPVDPGRKKGNHTYLFHGKHGVFLSRIKLSTIVPSAPGLCQDVIPPISSSISRTNKRKLPNATQINPNKVPQSTHLSRRRRPDEEEDNFSVGLSILFPMRSLVAELLTLVHWTRRQSGVHQLM